MYIELEVEGIDGVSPHQKNTIIIGVDIYNVEEFAFSMFNRVTNNNKFQEFRTNLIKECISSFLHSAGGEYKRELKEFVEEIFEY